jgi:hypothetical protein
MADFAKTENQPVTIAGAGQIRKVLSGYGTIAAAGVNGTINVSGQLSRVTGVRITNVNHFETICVLSAQPVDGVLTFERDNQGADVSFWYEIEGY